MTETELKMKKDTTYLVMKIYSAYAVLVDNDGRFIKAANKGYNVGDVVCDIIPIIYPADRAKKRRHIIQLAASLAACVCLGIFGVYEYQYLFLPYGTVQMQINPLIQMTLSRSGRVIDLEGLNSDGKALLKDYNYKGKDAEQAADELADLAIEMNYLEDGGQIGLLADSDSTKWTSQTENDLADSLYEHLKEQSITVDIHTGTINIEEDSPIEKPQSITIPIPDTSSQEESSEPAPAGPETPAPSVPVQPQQPAVPSDDSGYDSSGDSGYDASGDSGYDSDD